MKSSKSISMMVLLFVITSCTHQSFSFGQNFSSNKVDNSITNEVTANYKDAILLEGNFRITKTDKNQVAIYTETKDSKHLFLLSGIEYSILSKMKITSLFYLQDGILLNNKIFIGVDGNVKELLMQNVKKISSLDKPDNQYTIKTLVHNWYSKEDNAYKNLSADQLITNYNTVTTNIVREDCTAGGAGSTGCSLGSGSTGCSVSCGSGYHSCCIYTAMGSNDCHCTVN